MEELKKRINDLMTDNEILKASAIKVCATGIKGNVAQRMYSNAKRENIAYQNVMEIIKDIEHGEETKR